MSLASQRLPVTSIHRPDSRVVNIFQSALLPVSRRWAHTSRSVLFATYAFKRRQSSAMASESLNPSETDQEHHQRRSNTQGREGTPYAARAAAGAAAASSFFPLGYREGFSQWVSRPDHVSGQSANQKPSGLVSLLQLQSIRSSPIFHICITNPQPTSKPVTQRTSPTAQRRAV